MIYSRGKLGAEIPKSPSGRSSDACSVTASTSPCADHARVKPRNHQYWAPVHMPENGISIELSQAQIMSFHVRRAHRRGFVHLYGTVAPAEVGAQVGFQLLAPGRSTNEGGTVVKVGTPTVSRFSRVIRVRHRGLCRALVKISNDGAHVSNYSEPVLVR